MATQARRTGRGNVSVPTQRDRTPRSVTTSTRKPPVRIRINRAGRSGRRKLRTAPRPSRGGRIRTTTASPTARDRTSPSPLSRVRRVLPSAVAAAMIAGSGYPPNPSSTTVSASSPSDRRCSATSAGRFSSTLIFTLRKGERAILPVRGLPHKREPRRRVRVARTDSYAIAVRASNPRRGCRESSQPTREFQSRRDGLHRLLESCSAGFANSS